MSLTHLAGVIYDANLSSKSGQVLIGYSRLKVLQRVGFVLLLLGVGGIFLTVQPIISSELVFRFSKRQPELTGFGHLRAKSYTQEKEQAEKEYTNRIAQQFGITDTKFYIYIPKINARAKVIRNVDPGNLRTFEKALKVGVAHASGSSLPGDSGATYVFAHSTDSPWNIVRYNAVFYLLNELNVNDQDEIYVFYQDKLYKYKVAQKHIVDGRDTSWLTQANLGPARLVLQTCWPPGTTWKRLIIVAKI